MGTFDSVKKIAIVVGTRPNFIKVTRMKEVGVELGLTVSIIHTGQHYDQNMANVFFEQFELLPDVFLETSAQSPKARLGKILQELILCFEEMKPDVVVVPGDVDSTLAGAIAANKLGIPLAHLESGLRSADRTMPEEINRILTDEISDFCFVTEQSGLDHLQKEEKPQSSVHMVGNTMIDTMVKFDEEIRASQIGKHLGVEGEEFVLLTFHRPALVDTREGLEEVVEILNRIPEKKVLPLHPRTRKNLQAFAMLQEWESREDLILVEPMGYFDFQYLILNAKWVLTDSGGIQEETTFRQVPCITLRPNTERPSTIEVGTNRLVYPNDKGALYQAIEDMNAGKFPEGKIPDLWDGKATERVLKVLLNS